MVTVPNTSSGSPGGGDRTGDLGDGGGGRSGGGDSLRVELPLDEAMLPGGLYLTRLLLVVLPPGVGGGLLFRSMRS